MGGFNLPPGCNVSDIPGNEPHDHFAEKFEEDLCEKFPEVGKMLDSEYTRDQHLYGTIVEIANWGFSEGCGQGYADATADLGIVHEVAEADRVQKNAEILAKAKGQLQILVCVRDTCAKEYELGNGSMDKEDYDDQKKALDNLTSLINELA